jgi:hypothetical protein
VRKTRLILLAVLAVMAAVAWFPSRRNGFQVSVQFVGYTNSSWGEHLGMVQVSNASPFVVVRARSPIVLFDSPAAPVGYAPIGWALIQPGECELVMTEPITNRSRWRMTISCQRLDWNDDYCGSSDRGVRAFQKSVASWLEVHRAPLRIPSPSPRPYVQFSSDWVEP